MLIKKYDTGGALDYVIDEAIKQHGGTPKDYHNLMDAIAYHESDKTMDPGIKQYQGGPGRGMFQFEMGLTKDGKTRGAATALNRAKMWYRGKGVEPPKFVTEGLKDLGAFDPSKLSAEEQKILFVIDYLEHPKAKFGDVWKGDMGIDEFWATYHQTEGTDTPQFKKFSSDLEEYLANNNIKRYKNRIPKDSTQKIFQETLAKEENPVGPVPYTKENSILPKEPVGLMLSRDENIGEGSVSTAGAGMVSVSARQGQQRISGAGSEREISASGESGPGFINVGTQSLARTGSVLAVENFLNSLRESKNKS